MLVSSNKADTTCQNTIAGAGILKRRMAANYCNRHPGPSAANRRNPVDSQHLELDARYAAIRRFIIPAPGLLRILTREASAVVT